MVKHRIRRQITKITDKLSQNKCTIFRCFWGYQVGEYVPGSLRGRYRPDATRAGWKGSLSAGRIPVLESTGRSGTGLCRPEPSQAATCMSVIGRGETGTMSKGDSTCSVGRAHAVGYAFEISFARVLRSKSASVFPFAALKASATALFFQTNPAQLRAGLQITLLGSQIQIPKLSSTHLLSWAIPQTWDL